MNCKVRVSFLGCDCGCTPYQMMTFVSENQDSAVRAAAGYCLDHTHKGKDPFSKIKAPAEVLELAKKVFVLIDDVQETTKLNKELMFNRDAMKWAMSILEIKKLSAKKAKDLKQTEENIKMNTIKLDILKKQVDNMMSYPDNTVETEKPPEGLNVSSN